MSKKVERKKAFCVRFSKTTRRALERIAKEQEIPTAQLLRKAAKEFLERERAAGRPAEA